VLSLLDGGADRGVGVHTGSWDVRGYIFRPLACFVVTRRALMREVVGFIQLACALTLGMAGGWAVHQMGVVMGWSGF
jgi:hypothetical protein